MKVGSQVNYIVLGNGRWSNNYRKSLILNSLPENIIDFANSVDKIKLLGYKCRPAQGHPY